MRAFTWELFHLLLLYIHLKNVKEEICMYNCCGTSSSVLIFLCYPEICKDEEKKLFIFLHVLLINLIMYVYIRNTNKDIHMFMHDETFEMERIFHFSIIFWIFFFSFPWNMHMEKEVARMTFFVYSCRLNMIWWITATVLKCSLMLAHWRFVWIHNSFLSKFQCSF